jgi:prepilin-type N-terminal cleavage/methylation domain-containing protein
VTAAASAPVAISLAREMHHTHCQGDQTMGTLRSKAGWTLVELMVVVAVIGIMATLGIPSLIRIMPRLRLNGDATTLSNEIALARMRAVTKSADVRIVFDAANGKYSIAKYQGGAWASLGTTTLTGSTITDITGFSTPDTLIAYASGGFNIPLNSQAIIELQTADGTFQKRVVVEPSGRMYAERRTAGGAWVQD